MLQDALVLQNGRGELAELHIGFGDALGSDDDVMFATELGIGLFEDFEGLVVERLGLRDNFEHLNCLQQLSLFIRSQSSSHSSLVLTLIVGFRGEIKAK